MIIDNYKMIMKKIEMPLVNSGHGPVPSEDNRKVVRVKDSYSTAEMLILSLETESFFLSVSVIDGANVDVREYDDGFSESPEDDYVISF